MVDFSDLNIGMCTKAGSMKQYRMLEKGEIIQPFDECDGCVDPLKDEPEWRPVNPNSIGESVPDPSYPSHTIYRRLLNRIYMVDFDDSSIWCGSCTAITDRLGR